MMLIVRAGTSIDYQSRLLGKSRVGFVRVSLKAIECVLLRLRLDAFMKNVPCGLLAKRRRAKLEAEFDSSDDI